MWTLAGEWRVVSRPEYVIDVEDWRNAEAQMTFVHSHVRVWAPSVLKRIKSDFKLLRETVRGHMYATSSNPDAKWVKFVKLFGFEHLLNYDDGDIRKTIYILRDNYGLIRNEHSNN